MFWINKKRKQKTLTSESKQNKTFIINRFYKNLIFLSNLSKIKFFETYTHEDGIDNIHTLTDRVPRLNLNVL